MTVHVLHDGGFYREIDGPAGLVESARSTGLSHSSSSAVAALSRRQGVLGPELPPVGGTGGLRHRCSRRQTGEELGRRRLVRPRRARRRDLGRRALRGPRSRGVVDGPQHRPRPESRLRRHVRHLASPKVPAGRIENTHLYHNSTLALDADPARSAGYYQHLHDDWDLDHPFKRLLVDRFTLRFMWRVRLSRLSAALVVPSDPCRRVERCSVRTVSVSSSPSRTRPTALGYSSSGRLARSVRNCVAVFTSLA